jgi:predicted NBD/HSP70 family sugar kinase
LINHELKDRKGSKFTILQTLRIKGSMSRIELTRITGLNRATVSAAIADLIQSNLVQETDHRLYTGGRPATTLELVPNSNLIIGADFDRYSWMIGAFDLLGNVVKTMKVPVNGTAPETCFKTLAAGIRDFAQTLDPPPIRLLGVGVPGLVDADHGVITSAAQFDWFHVDVKKIMQEELGWPTVVVNRFRARGLTECRYGSGRSFNHLVYIGVGTGIAAGLYIDRLLLSGALGGAGELGHITVEPNGPLCACGNHGCLQALSSEQAIEQEFRRLLRAGEKTSLMSSPEFDLQRIKAFAICQAADEGDELAARVVGHAASHLGIAMANLVNIFNPEAIILGGAIPSASRLFVQTAEKVMRQRSMSSLAKGTAVETASFHDLGGALGAANFALDKNLELSFFA